MIAVLGPHAYEGLVVEGHVHTLWMLSDQPLIYHKPDSAYSQSTRAPDHSIVPTSLSEGCLPAKRSVQLDGEISNPHIYNSTSEQRNRNTSVSFDSSASTLQSLKMLDLSKKKFELLRSYGSHRLRIGL